MSHPKGVTIKPVSRDKMPDEIFDVYFYSLQKKIGKTLNRYTKLTPEFPEKDELGDIHHLISDMNDLLSEVLRLYINDTCRTIYHFYFDYMEQQKHNAEKQARRK